MLNKIGLGGGEKWVTVVAKNRPPVNEKPAKAELLSMAKLALSRFIGQASIRTLFEPASFMINDNTDNVCNQNVVILSWLGIFHVFER